MGKLALALLFLVGLSSAAFAEIKICNNFEHPIFVAIAWSDNDLWKSEGWLKVESNECRVDDAVPTDLTSFYYRGETDWIDADNGKQTQWTWGNQKKFSVTNDSFDFDNADSKQKKARFEEFSGPIDLGDSDSQATLSFVENVTNISITHPHSNDDNGTTNDNTDTGTKHGGDDSGG